MVGNQQKQPCIILIEQKFYCKSIYYKGPIKKYTFNS